MTYRSYIGRGGLLRARQQSELHGHEDHKSHINEGRAAGADYVVVGREVHGESGMTLGSFSELISGDETIDAAELRIEGPDWPANLREDYKEIMYVYDVRAHPLLAVSSPETKKKLAFWIAWGCVAAGILCAMIPLLPAAGFEPLPGFLLSALVAILGFVAVVKIQNLPEWDILEEAWDFYGDAIPSTPLHWFQVWQERVDLHKELYGWRHPIKWFLNRPVRVCLHLAYLGFLIPLGILVHGILPYLPILPGLLPFFFLFALKSDSG